ncbi:MG2 domain-containing protein [Sorangium sp. So ce1504]|uniref:MG2 domain-containing protein n=1 Tax=Sorangium sp. So ce1504 TaxID=3133337 RepID=UPI003F5DDA2F
MRVRFDALRRRWSSPHLLAALALASAFAAGCSSDEAPPTTLGRPDQPRNGTLEVDEARLLGVIDGSDLRLQIPVRNLTAGATSGHLRVTLVDLDADREQGTTEVDLEIAGGTATTAEARLPAPAVSAQPRLARYLVRVDDGSEEGLLVTRSLLRVIPPYDVQLEGPARVVRGRTASYRVRATDAFSHQPVPNVDVELAVGEGARPLRGTTDALGAAVFEVEPGALGAHPVSAQALGFGVNAALTANITVEGPGPKLLLTTDKPLYKPGQTIHLRALALERGNNAPLVREAITFEVEDGKGNKIFKKPIETDAYGVAATTFRIGSIVNTGEFKVRLVSGETTTEKVVTVGQYALPKFEVAVRTDRPWYTAGDTLTGTIDARYFFGKNVAGGSVTIEAASLDVGQTTFQRIVGELDAEGHYGFSLTLPPSLAGLPLEQGDAAVTLTVTVADTAGQEVTKAIPVKVAADAASIVLVPEARELVPGIPNTLLLFVTDPLGAPLPDTEAVITAPDRTQLTARTDAFGQAVVSFTPPVATADGAFEVRATVGERAVTRKFSFGTQTGGEHLLVRTDRAVYETGETVEVTIESSEEAGSVYVDWLNDGQAVDMRSLELEGGRAHFSMPVDAGLLGSNRVEAYLVDDDGNLVRSGRTVFARGDSALSVEVEADKPLYAPGETATLRLSVKDDAGNPKVAALGVQVVDQAVFALVDAQPGLLRTYFELEDEFAKPSYEIHGPAANLQDLLFNATASEDPEQAEAAQVKTQASLAALAGTSLTGLQARTWPAVLAKVPEELAQFNERQKGVLKPWLADATAAAAQELKALGCDSTQFSCNGQGVYVELLGSRVAERLRGFDVWGNAYRVASSWSGLTLQSSGPDEVAQSQDDATFAFTFGDLGIPVPPQEWNEGGIPDADGGWANGAASGTGAGTGAGGGSAGDPTAEPGGDNGGGPRVRREFPETLYVNPSVITSPDGTATLSIPLADSITEWRLSALANSTDGKLGGIQSGFKVFQDFFVDVSFPATLTRGDEVEFPIAVYNYLETEQTVDLSLEPGSWYTPLGATSTTVSLAAGEVRGVRFPVKVNTVGVNSLTVTARGSAGADAVARTVRVVPDGKPFAESESGMLASGSAEHALSFPADAVPGSNQLYLEIYPAFLSQVVSGMDSMLQVPNGCFEQTTSTTWPNVLVTQYMKQTGQITPEIQMKAESLISAGYQRLLTFEHSGGGFSWFGEQDGHPYLSVTAFGVMEFADMIKVHTVDEAMLARTVNWLAGQQKADGTWEGDQTEFFSFHTGTLRNSAFVLWALASAGYTGPEIGTGLAYLGRSLKPATDDLYTLAIAANALAVADPSGALTDSVLDALDQRKTAEGDAFYWDDGGTQTSFYESGNDARVTTTALAAHALLSAGAHRPSADGGVKFLTQSKDPNGNFGSTQATIWSLRTLLLAASKGTEGATGTVTVAVDGAAAGTVPLRADQADVMTTVDLTHLATAGAHDVTLSFSGEGKLSYNLVSRHNLPWSAVPNDAGGPLAVSVTYDKTQLYVDDIVTASLSVQNKTDSVQSMVLVTVGLPPGFQLLTEDLQEYILAGQLSKFEITGKQLILYVKEIPAGRAATFAYRLQATMPVRAEDGGAEAHPYYQPEQQSFSGAQTFEVAGE